MKKAKQKTLRLAKTALILGIFSFLFIPLSFFAIIKGFISLKKIKEDPALHGKGCAIAGIILGIAALVLFTFIAYAVWNFVKPYFKSGEVGDRAVAELNEKICDEDPIFTNIQTCYRNVAYAKMDAARYSIIELWGIECLGCGYDVLLVGLIDDDNNLDILNAEVSLFHAQWGDAVCFDKFGEVRDERVESIGPLGFTDYYILKDEELTEIQECLQYYKEQDYCLDNYDCCGLVDCGLACIDNKCWET